jgi:hypothetical protein
VVLSIVNDLDRALVQAPVMRLKLRAEETDWDAAFELLTDEPTGQHPSRATPHDIREADPETERFRDLHQRLHERRSRSSRPRTATSATWSSRFDRASGLTELA